MAPIAPDTLQELAMPAIRLFCISAWVAAMGRSYTSCTRSSNFKYDQTDIRSAPVLSSAGRSRLCTHSVNKIVSIRKWWIAPAFKAAGGFEPEEYIEYFEDSNPPANAEIGCKMPFPDGHKIGIAPGIPPGAGSNHFNKMGIPIIGQRTATANPMTTISKMLAGMPYRKNSPGVNCLES